MNLFSLPLSLSRCQNISLEKVKIAQQQHFIYHFQPHGNQLKENKHPPFSETRQPLRDISRALGFFERQREGIAPLPAPVLSERRSRVQRLADVSLISSSSSVFSTIKVTI